MLDNDTEYFRSDNVSFTDDEKHFFHVQYNKYGFRGPEFDANKKNILIAGCSIHYGAGVSEQSIFPNLLIEKLGKEYGYLNVSRAGSGIDAEIKNIIWALNNFKFEKLLWLSPGHHRSLYYHEDIGVLHYNPALVDESFNHWFKTVQGKRWVEARISNNFDTARKYCDQLEVLFLLLKTLKIESYVSSWDTDGRDNNFDSKLSPLRLKYDVKPLPYFYRTDLAYDKIHPGIKSHNDYAEALYQLIKG